MIPKIIHHVWPGDDPFKNKFHSFRKSWMEKHPDWTFYFWRLDNLPDNINPKVLEILNDDKYNITIKSDVLRVEVVRLFGGIYVDTDMECLKPFDDLLNNNLFLGFETPGVVCPSLIGGTKNNKILFEILENILYKIQTIDINFVNTFPHEITGKTFTEITPYREEVTLYPIEYFYPISYREKIKLNEDTPNSYSKHHWSGLDDDGWAKHITLKDVFSKIYENDVWTNGSGPGSNPDAVKNYVENLINTIKKYNIKTVLDYGCGDWQFSKFIDWENLVDSYVGVDIVDGLIDHHNKNYSTNKVKFEYLTNDWKFPKVDLIICKDVLQHLPNDIANGLLDSFEQSSSYMLITNDVNKLNTTLDCDIGGWRPLDLTASPYNKEPLVLFVWDVPPHVKNTLLIKNENWI